MTRTRRAAAVGAATLAVLALQLLASSRIDGPSVAFDETGYLGNARWLAGVGAGWEMPTAPRYAIGYPALLAPVMRVFATPAAQWRAIMVLNAVLLAGIVPLVYALARRALTAPPRAALWAAIAAAVVPAALSAGVTATAENLALVLVPASLLALDRLLRSGATPVRLLFGPAVALLAATHSRYTATAVMAAILLALLAWRRAAPRWVVAGNAGLLVAGLWLGWALSAAVGRARWDHVERIEGRPTDVLELVRSLDGWGELAKAAVGQAWYLAAGSIALSVIGVIAIAQRVARGSVSEPGDGDLDAPSWVLGFALASAASVFAMSVAFFAQTHFRADHLVYGRHNDSFTPLWVAAALVALQVRSRASVARLLAIAAAATGCLFAVLALVQDADAFGGVYSPYGVSALMRAVAHDPSGTYWRASLAAGIALGVIALVVLVARRPALVAPLVAAWFAWVGLATVDGVDRFEDFAYLDWRIPEELDRLGVDSLTVDVRSVDLAWPTLLYPFHLPDVEVATFDPLLGDAPESPYVVARVDDERRRAAGDRIALIDRSGYVREHGAPQGLALWVRPGPDQDRLEAAGWLLPAGYPTGLPVEARAATVAIDRHPAQVGSGGSVTFDVRLRHDGQGSPWPGWSTHDAGGTGVRVIATVTSLDGSTDGAPVYGPIERWVLPGDDLSATVTVHAVDDLLQPLPPGRYRVEVGVGQATPAWLASGPDSTFVLVVTP